MTVDQGVPGRPRAQSLPADRVTLYPVARLNDPCKACGADEWIDLHPEDPDGHLLCGPCFTRITGIASVSPTVGAPAVGGGDEA